MPLVLDASVTLNWAFESLDETDPVLRRLLDDDALVPDLWPYEVANGLLAAVRRGLLTVGQRDMFLQRLHRLPVVVEVTGAERTLGPILVLAEQQGLTVYDASYLELARREGCALATADAALRAAAMRVGVDVLA